MGSEMCIRDRYGDIPLDLFDTAADARAPSAEVASREAKERMVQTDPDIVTKQHAALGNPMAAKVLANKKGQAEVPSDSLATSKEATGNAHDL